MWIQYAVCLKFVPIRKNQKRQRFNCIGKRVCTEQAFVGSFRPPLQKMFNVTTNQNEVQVTALAYVMFQRNKEKGTNFGVTNICNMGVRMDQAGSFIF